jgi:hypothetical protein
VICAGILLAGALFLLAAVWDRHFSWWIRLSALLPLAASVAAEIAAQHLFDTYASWAGFLPLYLGGTAPESTRVQILHALDNANQEASVLGWVGVIVMGILLAVVLLGCCRRHDTIFPEGDDLFFLHTPPRHTVVESRSAPVLGSPPGGETNYWRDKLLRWTPLSRQ